MPFCVCLSIGNRPTPDSPIFWELNHSKRRSPKFAQVRPSLIPVLISYFQSRNMRIKWHGALSQPRKMPGSGAMGSSIGNQEFSSQTNHNSDCVPKENRFKFVDELSVLEIVNLISIGIEPFDIMKQVPNDLQIHGQFVDSQKLKSQEYLNQINRWTVQQEMII